MGDGHFQESFDWHAYSLGCANGSMESIMSMASHWNSKHVSSPQIIPWVLSPGLTASSKMDGVDIDVIIPGELCSAPQEDLDPEHGSNDDEDAKHEK